ncbi:MAG: sulfotransferase [Xanthomonadales bacterium]|nr:sulfotransferase [Xanthomonadales bacterium]
MSSQQIVPARLENARAALAARDYRRVHQLCTEALLRQPQTADAFFLLAMLAADHHNYAKALEVIDRALAIAPQRAEYLAHKGRFLLAVSRPREALEAALAGVDTEVDSALTWDTLGVVLTRAGAHREAIAPFQRAVAADPDKAAYRYNLGAALQFAGDFAGAEAAYRAALAIEPQMASAWSALAQVRKAPFDEAQCVQLTQALNAGKPDADAELHLCHALAKQREDEGRYAESFALLSRGKARKRGQLDYQINRDLALFEAAQESASQLATRDWRGCDSAEPIFIVGMPRTGTTLVERILSSHPQVYAAGELSHFSLALKRLSATPGAHVLDPDTLRAAAGVDPAQLGQAYVSSTRPRTGHTPRFIDKMPLNFFYAGIIRRALPKAKIICLRRNPLDTILSNYRQLFATGFSYYNYAYDLLDCARYWQSFDQLMEHWSKLLGDAFLEVHYEQVVADLEGQARRLLAHCELPWDRTCLNFHNNASPVATASSVQVRQPIYTAAVERWRRYADQLAPVVALLNLENRS